MTILARTTVVLSLAAIDPPTLDARIDRDPEKLEELARDILRRGLKEPIKVFRKGDRYEVIDGCRRYLASCSAGLSEIECFVEEAPSLEHEGTKYALGAYREDFSPAEEAMFFNQLLTHECANDIERVAALVGKRVGYVDRRLQLVLGDELVFDAVKARKITLGAAELLNTIDKPDYRRYYLEHAIRSGASVTVLTGWIQEYQNLYGDQPQLPPREEAPAGAAPFVPAYDPHRCDVCRKSDHRLTIQVNVHGSCNEAILQPLLATYRGDESATG